MKIIVGLGNIGDKYKNTRHNSGFTAVDEYLKKLQKEKPELQWEENKKFKAICVKTSTKEGQEILLVKPTTLMNLSGEAIINILNFYKEDSENLIVIYDDIDLPLGKIRVRKEGSAGTHNGMKSIINNLGTENFSRIRIGIESRGLHAPQHQDLAEFVLSDFFSTEQKELEKSLNEAIQELKKMLI